MSRLNLVAARFGLQFAANRPDECNRLTSDLVLRAHPDKGGDGRSVDEVATIRRDWREALRSEARRLSDGQPVQPEPERASAQATPAPHGARDIGWIASNYYSARVIRCGHPNCCGRAARLPESLQCRLLLRKRFASPEMAA